MHDATRALLTNAIEHAEAEAARLDRQALDLVEQAAELDSRAARCRAEAEAHRRTLNEIAARGRLKKGRVELSTDRHGVALRHDGEFVGWLSGRGEDGAAIITVPNWNLVHTQ